jgi:hypothetical protein
MANALAQKNAARVARAILFFDFLLCFESREALPRQPHS